LKTDRLEKEKTERIRQLNGDINEIEKLVLSLFKSKNNQDIKMKKK